MAGYEAIAAAIRARIEAGTLRPGDRVPSTRAITREWGVAVATATKALRALQAQGLVRGVVGVGTVVAAPPLVAPPATAAPARGPLTTGGLVAAAIALADAEGLPAVTMRRLATELDVAVMSLYRHVPSKDDLILLMCDQVLGEAPVPAPEPPEWRARVEAIARSQWGVVHRHPWLPAVSSLTRPLLAPNGMAQTDYVMGVLRELGFDPPAALQITVAIAGLVLGIGGSVQLEADARRETGLTDEQWMQARSAAVDHITTMRDFPNIAEVSALPGFDLLLDDVFEVGLALILDGVAARLPTGRAQAPAVSRAARIGGVGFSASPRMPT